MTPKNISIWGNREVLQILGVQPEWKTTRFRGMTSREVGSVILHVVFDCGHEGHIRRTFDPDSYMAIKKFPSPPPEGTYTRGACSTCAGEMENG